MITRANILFNLYKIATEGTIKSILGFNPDIAKLISDRFGRRAFLYAKWFKEYLKEDNKEIKDLNPRQIEFNMSLFDSYISDTLSLSQLNEYHYITDDEMLDLLNPFVTIFEKGTLFNKFKGMGLEEAMEEYKKYFINHSKVQMALGSIKCRGELSTIINGSRYHFKNIGEECQLATILMHNCGQITYSAFGSEGEYFNSVNMTMHLIIKDSSKAVVITTSGYINGFSHPDGGHDYRDEIDGKFIVNAEGPAGRKIEDEDVMKALEFFINYNNLRPAIVHDFKTGEVINHLNNDNLAESGNLTNIWIQSESDAVDTEMYNNYNNDDELYDEFSHSAMKLMDEEEYTDNDNLDTSNILDKKD